MTTETLTLTDFLLARIAEDEAVAREAGPEYAWYSNSRDVEGRRLLNGVEEDAPDFDEEMDVFCAATKAHARHIARHDPARVLAECNAKRVIVELRYSWNLQAERMAEPPFGPILQTQVNTADAVLRTLAAVYADHPDYRDEWHG